MKGEGRRNPQEVLEILLEGNRRFQGGEGRNAARCDPKRRAELAAGQKPLAAILTCADSRTSPTILFDAGLGELFVCRNAGNIVDDLMIGSLEYASAHLGVSLVAVMGHNNCGAVAAAVAAAKDPSRSTRGLDTIVHRLLLPVLAARGEGLDNQTWINAAARRNVAESVEELLRHSVIIREKVEQGQLKVVGLWYDLASGRVELI